MSDIQSLTTQALADVAAASSPDALEALRVALLGKNGSITAQLKQLGALPADERKAAGEAITTYVKSQGLAIDGVDIAFELHPGEDLHDGVTFDDGSFACVAQVSAPGDSFSLGVLQDQTVKLQFYSDDWQFDEGTADLMIQIDRRSPWTLNEADLYENSVLFTLGDDDAAYGFINEIARGSRLYLMDDGGDGVKDYSLAGSSASIAALGECGDVLNEDPSNPFK